MNHKVKQFIKVFVPSRILRSTLTQRLKRTKLKSNPWTYEQTFLTLSSGEALSNVHEQFRKYGILKLKNAIPASDVEDFLRLIKSLSGLDDDDYELVRRHRKRGFSMVGGVTQTEGLWPLILNPEIVRVLHKILGEPPKYLGRDTVGVNLDAYSFHRDVQEQPRDAGYTELRAEAQFDVVKTIFYFQSPGRMSYRFGFKPYSHLDLFNTATRTLSRRSKDVVWIDVAPEDCIVFNPFLVHAGEKLRGPKYMVILSYCRDTEFSSEVYYRSVYGCVVGQSRKIAPRLKVVLSDKNLLMRAVGDVESERYFKEKLARENRPLSYASYNK